MRVVHRRSRGLITGGAAMLGISYSLAVIVRTALCVSAACSPASGWLYAPGFGAIVYAGTVPNALYTMLGAFDAILQNVGAIMLLAGTTTRRAYLEPESDNQPLSWSIVPAGPAGTVGLTFALSMP
jgi:hypothetical protein